MRRPRDEIGEWLGQPTAWIILLVGALASLFAWRSLTIEVEHAAATSFETTVTDSRAAVESRLRGYHVILHGMQGLFQAGPAIDRARFNRYIDSIAHARGSGRVRSFSYAHRVTLAQRAQFERQMRTVHPEFRIKPAVERPEYMAITFVEPYRENAAGIGLDLMGDSTRRAATERARDMGVPVATAPFALVSAPGAGVSAVSLRMAVYRPGEPLSSLEGRRHAFAGLVSVTFLVPDVVEDIVQRHSPIALRLCIKDGASGQVVYDSGAGDHPAGTLVRRVPLEVGGRAWDLEFSAPLSRFLTSGEARTPWLTLAGGLVITLLLAGLVASLSISTRRAHRIAGRITEDLRRSEADLADAHQRTALLIETLPNPVFFKGTDGRYLGVNRAWEAFFGTSRSDIVGKTVHDLYTHAPEVADRLDAKDQELWRRPGTQTYETSIRLPDGSVRETIYYKATFTGPDGNLAGLIGTIVDISGRKLAEKRQAMEHAITRQLAATDDVNDALETLLRTMCEAEGWACGRYFGVDEAAGVLRFVQGWGQDVPGVGAFLAHSRAMTYSRGQGLSGTAWQNGKPVWVRDATQDTRATGSSRAAGLSGGSFVFPVLFESRTLGVLSFSSNAVREPDEPLIQAMHAIASQIGQFIVRREAEDKVRFVATHDALTGLPNRLMFAQRLEHALAQARRRSGRLAILFIDLDRFKLINDTLGHEAGDTLLRAVASRLSEHLRASDTVARLGGDEFVVLLEDFTEPHYVAGVSQKLIEALARAFVLGGREYHVSASIGVSTYPDDSTSMQDLLKNADIAMYRAKDHGRNTFQFYSEQMNVHSVERLALESGLRRALERDELVLHFQPQASVRSSHITGVEALVRWHHPELGLLPPVRFIPLAEESGLVVPLGEWVLRHACTRMRAWLDAGVAPPRLSVNLSPRQFLHGDLTGMVERVLAQTGCPGSVLELEITESMVMHNPERAVELMYDIRQMGVKVAIDDFGTGYSSLGALKRFPVDNLKVDRSFIADIPADKDDAAITQAVIVMAHSLGMKVIAEGVETQEQYKFLRRHDCDEMQGYYFSRPLPEAELVALLRGAAPVARAS